YSTTLCTILFVFFTIHPPTSSTLFPYTTLFRSHKHHVCAKTMKSTVFEHMRLGLKPLSSVTDEDLKDLATQVAGISPSEYASANMVAHKRYKQFIVSIKKEELELDVVDFLRSRGYALPAFGYSVDELVE